MNQRKRSAKSLFGIAIGTAIVLAWSLPQAGLAQYRVDDTQGHTLDANNRLGSGGYNGSVGNPAASNAYSIFLGNTTGFGNFHGNVPYRDPYSFQGNIPFQPSLLLQQVSGTNSPTAAPTYNVPRQFYNYETAVNAPPGFSSQTVGGVYQVAPPDVRAPADYRLGDVLGVAPTSAITPGGLPTPGQIAGPGAVNMAADMTPSFLNASPLYGLRQLDIQPGGQSSASVNGTPTPGLQAGLSAEDIVRLRGELSQSATPWLVSTASASPTTQPGAEPGQYGSLAASASMAPQPIQAGLTGTQSIGAANLSQQAALQAGAAVTGGASTGQMTRHYLPPVPLPPPSQQSAQYSHLHQLLLQYQNSHPQSDEEANRLFQRALRARRAYEQSLGKAPAPSAPAAAEPGAEQPGANSAPPPAPMDIGSIGQGIRASGLSDLVKQGEDLARRQQFKDAINKFLDARQVAPNNMLISIDLANAELGAGFYNQAEGFLREAFTADPATLMARYDVKSVIGDDRLQSVIGDLKHIAATGSDATPVFLLAYLSYNTGESDKAVEYLKLAQSRAGGQDDVIRSLGEHWSLPPATQPSK